MFPGGDPKIVGYARVSTAGQDLSLQLDSLANAGCGRVFHDVASGAKITRQGLDAALSYLRPGDTLVIWKIDRLGRSLGHLVQIIEDLRKRNIGFRSITDAAIDTTTPGGTLIFHIFASLATFERELIGERTKAGLSAAAVRGRRGGRRPVVTASKLAKAHDLLGKGLSVRQAAAAIKISKTALYEALRSPAEGLSEE
ncbi:MAG: invertase [Gammaproteobacteria bacterium RIFCSPLOWO2_02_FULL_57_10]|nr:MAG: invertase [Gammaproteobacteria bacterium RIFCSPLOWO2_02_FULL_57_10]